MKKKIVREYGNNRAVREEWKLRLYVTDWTPRCTIAYRNIKRICAEHLNDRCEIEVIDLLENPGVARSEQIVAIPTLVKITPKPERVLVGDFSKEERVLKGLDIETASEIKKGDANGKQKKAKPEFSN